MTAERRPVSRGNVDPLALALAAAIREIQAKRVADRLERRARMELVLGGTKSEGEAA